MHCPLTPNQLMTIRLLTLGHSHGSIAEQHVVSQDAVRHRLDQARYRLRQAGVPAGAIYSETNLMAFCIDQGWLQYASPDERELRLEVRVIDADGNVVRLARRSVTHAAAVEFETPVTDDAGNRLYGYRLIPQFRQATEVP